MCLNCFNILTIRRHRSRHRALREVRCVLRRFLAHHGSGRPSTGGDPFGLASEAALQGWRPLRPRKRGNAPGVSSGPRRGPVEMQSLQPERSPARTAGAETDWLRAHSSTQGYTTVRDSAMRSRGAWRTTMPRGMPQVSGVGQEVDRKAAHGFEALAANNRSGSAIKNGHPVKNRTDQ